MTDRLTPEREQKIREHLRASSWAVSDLLSEVDALRSSRVLPSPWQDGDDEGYPEHRPTMHQLEWAKAVLERGPCKTLDDCPTFYDWCNCEAVAGAIFEAEVDILQEKLDRTENDLNFTNKLLTKTSKRFKTLEENSVTKDEIRRQLQMLSTSSHMTSDRLAATAARMLNIEPLYPDYPDATKVQWLDQPSPPHEWWWVYDPMWPDLQLVRVEEFHDGFVNTVDLDGAGNSWPGDLASDSAKWTPAPPPPRPPEE